MLYKNISKYLLQIHCTILYDLLDFNDELHYIYEYCDYFSNPPEPQEQTIKESIGSSSYN